MAGHRSATSLGLVFGSVAPVTLLSVLLWGVLDVPASSLTLPVLLVGGALAAIAPYAIGWERGVVSLLVLTTGVPWVVFALRAQPVGWRIGAAALLVVAVSALTWWTLRLGYVRRPADAKQWKEKEHDDSWPYPYA